MRKFLYRIGRESMGCNVQKLIAIGTLHNALFFAAVFLPFIVDAGLEQRDMFWLEEVFCLCMLLCTFPAGRLSDRIGRKPLIVCGSVVFCTGLVLYAIGCHAHHVSTSRGLMFTLFLVAEGLLGIGLCCVMSSNEALIFESLPGPKGRSLSRKVLGNAICYWLIAQAGASILGGWLAEYSLPLTMWLSAGCALMALLLALRLREPVRHTCEHAEARTAAVWTLMRTSMRCRLAISVFSVTVPLLMSLGYFTQLYQEHLAMDLRWFGLLHGAIVLCSAMCSRYAHSLERHVCDGILLVSISCIVILVYLLLGFTSSLWGLFLFFLARGIWGALSTVSSDMISRSASEHIRASALSLRHVGTRGLYCACCPIFAAMMGVYTLNEMMLYTGLTGGTLLALGLVVTFVGGHRQS